MVPETVTKLNDVQFQNIISYLQANLQGWSLLLESLQKLFYKIALLVAINELILFIVLILVGIKIVSRR